MKRKHIIPVTLASLAISFGVFAGALAQKETKEVKASIGDDLMLLISFDASGIGRDWRDQCSNFRIHLWGTGGYDKTFTFHESGYEDLFFYNLTLNTQAQQINGYQFIFDQNGSPQYSEDWNAAAVTDFYNSNSYNRRAINYYFDEGDWIGTKWPSGYYCPDPLPSIAYYEPDGDFMMESFRHTFQYNRFESRAITITNSNINRDIVINLSQRPEIVDYAYSLFSSTDLIIKGNSNNSFRFKNPGIYTLYLNNTTKTTEVGGVITKGCLDVVPEDGSHVVNYVYYVSQNANEDGHINAYTFSSTTEDIHSLGEWPGKSLEELGAVKVNLINGFRFENTSANVYKIPLGDYGISSLWSDDSIIFNYTGEAYGQTANLLLQNKATYWRGSLENTVNLDAGKALDLFFDLQEVLSNVSSYRYNEMDLDNSICAISSSEAARLYLAYSTITSSIRTKYLDASYINVYTPNGSGKEYISAYDVFQKLGERGGLINNSRLSVLVNLSDNDIAMIIAIISATIISIASIGAFIILKKRKHN